MKRVLIIGAGGIANRHASALSNIEDVKVAGVCDISWERAGSLAQRFGTGAYTEIDDALDRSSPDYVVLLAPREVREPVVGRCAGAGLPIFMEKPPCDRISTGKRILGMIESAGLIHSVGFMHRWNDALNATLSRIAGERLSVINISFQSDFGTSPCYDRYPAPYLVERSGGLVGDQGIHYVDISRYITKSEVGRIQGAGANQLLPRSQDVSTCDVACWTLEMENGTIVSHSHTWCAPGWGCKIELVTDRSVVRVDMFNNTASGTVAGAQFDYSGTLDEFEAEHRGFLSALDKQDMSPVRSPYADALQSFRIAAEINRLIYGFTQETA
jgi:predicted dehydrogenase